MCLALRLSPARVVACRRDRLNGKSARRPVRSNISRPRPRLRLRRNNRATTARLLCAVRRRNRRTRPKSRTFSHKRRASVSRRPRSTRASPVRLRLQARNLARNLWVKSGVGGRAPPPLCCDQQMHCSKRQVAERYSEDEWVSFCDFLASSATFTKPVLLILPFRARPLVHEYYGRILWRRYHCCCCGDAKRSLARQNGKVAERCPRV